MFSPYRVVEFAKKKDPRYISGVACNMGAFLDADLSNALTASATTNQMGYTQGSPGVTKLATGLAKPLGISVYNVIAADAQGGLPILDLITGSANTFYDQILGQPTTIYKWSSNDEIITDQYLSGSGTGFLTIGAGSGNTPPETVLSVNAGKLRIFQTGDVAVAVLVGATHAPPVAMPTTTAPTFNPGIIVRFL